MHPYQTYDHARVIAAHRAQERAAWDRYAASMISGHTGEGSPDDAASVAADFADALLEKRRERYPAPAYPTDYEKN